MKKLVIIFYFTTIVFFTGCQTNNDGVVIPTQDTSATTFFSGVACDQIIDKKYYTICYDYGYKGALFVAYTLDGNIVNDPNIEERPNFYDEMSIPSAYRSRWEDYTGSGYDRGHLASDASFDYNQTALESVYSMANIVPQDPELNRSAWIDTEYLERSKAVEYGSVDVVIGVVYGDNPQRIGEDEIAVPQMFYKKISNKLLGYEACYQYENIPYDTQTDSLEDHVVSCQYFPNY